jgi:hypothetical protein
MMNTIKKPVVLSFAAFFSYLGMIAINGLANAIPLNGISTGEVSAQYETLFAPAGITFSIWGIIYLALLAFLIFQIRAAFSSEILPRLKQVTIFSFILSCLFNGLWIFAWHYEKLGVSVLLMLLLLASLIKIYFDIEAFTSKKNTVMIFVTIPFSIYLGWISVATVANISAWLVSIGWTGTFFSPETWTVIMISIASLLGVLMLFFRRNFTYAFVILWALYGIFFKNNQREVPFSEIFFITLTGMLIILATMGLVFFMKQCKSKQG